MSPPVNPQKKSRLLLALREGVGVVQMIFFKEIRTLLSEKFPDKSARRHSLLAGAVLNELFGLHNPEEHFQTFRKDNLALIEQQL